MDMPSPRSRANCDVHRLVADPSEFLPSLHSFGCQFFVRANSNFATLAGSHKGIGVCRILKGKAVSDDIGRMQIPAHEALDQFLHQPGRCHPGAVNSLLIVNHVGGRIEFNRSSFTYESNPSPFAGCSNGCATRSCIGRAVERALHTETSCEFLDLRDVVLTCC